MNRSMLAVCFDDAVVVREVVPPTVGPGQALLALRLAGICGTDLEVTRGYRAYQGVLGHEFVAQVVSCPDMPRWEGRRVTAEINITCGGCARCRGGLAKHCGARSVVGIEGHAGCFAEQLVVPIANLHAVPDAVTDEQAVFAEPLAAAFEIFESVSLSPRSQVAVIGDGRLGLLIVMALRSRDIPVVAIGRHPHKLALVAGPTVQAIDPAPLRAHEPSSFDVVIEATGSAQGLSAALEHVRPRGTVVLKSTVHGQVTLDTTRIVVDEIRLVGSRCGPFSTALDALRSGRIDPRPLIDKRYPLAQGRAAMDHAARRGALKIVLEGTAR